jgi:hypothetical protein
MLYVLVLVYIEPYLQQTRGNIITGKCLQVKSGNLPIGRILHSMIILQWYLSSIIDTYTLGKYLQYLCRSIDGCQTAHKYI